MVHTVAFVRLFIFSAILMSTVLLPNLCWAICSDEEFTAVFVVDNIYPAGNPQLRLLDVVQVGPETSPTIPEMIEAIVEAQPSSIPFTDYEIIAQEDPFTLFYHEPGDEGASTIVDSRDGRIVFYGTEMWLGFGYLWYPPESSHSWSFPAGDPAAEPASIRILPNIAWVVPLKLSLVSALQWPVYAIPTEKTQRLATTTLPKS